MGQASAGENIIDVLCGVDMCEVFSPPRVGVEAQKFGREPGDAMDLTTGWDLNKESDEAKAEEHIEKNGALLVIGSPTCTAFSQLQSLNPDTPESRMKWEKESST